MGELCRAADRSIKVYFEALTGEDLVPGIIVAVQTFGDRINFHPHLHLLVTEGGVDRAGIFHRIPRLDDARDDLASGAPAPADPEFLTPFCSREYHHFVRVGAYFEPNGNELSDAQKRNFLSLKFHK